MYRNIRRKYGKIPNSDADLLHAVREAGIEEVELARALSAKKQIARPQKEKEKEAAPKGKPEQKAAQAKEKERGPAVTTGGMGPNKNDKFPEQEILWESFQAAMKDVPEEEAGEFRQNDADCRRCGRGGHKTTACFAQSTSKGTKLPLAPKMPTKRVSATGTNRTQEDEPGEVEGHSAAIEARPKKALRTAATQRKVWEEESDSENTDIDMSDFP